MGAFFIEKREGFLEMKRFKKLGAIALGLAATVTLAACGGSKEATSTSDSDKVVTKVVGVAPGPYGDMATKVISPLLEKKGFKLTTKLFNDYVQPNKALASGQIDADLFQHTSYLEKFAADNDLKLSVVEEVPTLGMGIYSKKLKSLDDLEDGATVAIANDASNLARTLQLLAANNLITLKGDIDETKATVDDIATNPKNLTFKTLDAAQLVRSMDTVDIALVPGNYSWAADLDPADALALEKLKENYKNVFVVQTDEIDSDFAQELRRYMHQMIYEFTQIEHLVGVNRTRYNQYESIMLPLIQYLKQQGCQIVLNRRVVDWTFKDTPMQDEITVTGLHMIHTDTEEKEYVPVDQDTAVIFTNGSITDSATLGDFDTPAAENMDYGAASGLWKKATERFYNLGNPDKFFADRDASEWVSFTLTTKNHLLLNEITRITTQEPGNALNSFVSTTPITPLNQKDVTMSIVVHHQPPCAT